MPATAFKFLWWKSLKLMFCPFCNYTPHFVGLLNKIQIQSNLCYVVRGVNGFAKHTMKYLTCSVIVEKATENVLEHNLSRGIQPQSYRATILQFYAFLVHVSFLQQPTSTNDHTLEERWHYGGSSQKLLKSSGHACPCPSLRVCSGKDSTVPFFLQAE